jgi:hypothetical protein
MTSSYRQIGRLERLARPALEKIQQTIGQKNRQVAEQFWQDGLTHASNLSLLIRFGEPQEGEPLERAWDRCLASGAREVRVASTDSNNPFDNLFRARRMALYYRLLLPELEASGGNEAESNNAKSINEDLNATRKLIPIISQAPDWLLWFTYGELTFDALGLASLVTGELSFLPFMNVARSRLDYVRWPLLPRGAFHREVDQVRSKEWDRLLQEDPELYLDDQAMLARRWKAVLERYGDISGCQCPLFDPALRKDPERLEQAFNNTARHWPYWH